MMVSPYNVIVELEEEPYLVFNSVTGTLLTVSRNTYEYLKGKDKRRLDLRECRDLLRYRFIVTSRRKERRYVADRLAGYRRADHAVICTLVTTYACNLGCPYCYEEAIPERSGHMDRRTAVRAVRVIKEDLARTHAERLALTLYGGEPLLNLDIGLSALASLKRYCDKHGIEFSGSIISNGTLFNPQVIDRLSPCLHVVQLTLEGGRRYHDSLRRFANGRGTFDGIVRAARRLADRGIRVLFRIQVSPASVDSLDDCLCALGEEGLLQRPEVRLYFFPIMDVRGICSARSFHCCEKYYDRDMFRRVWTVAGRHSVDLLSMPSPVWISPYCSFVNENAWIIDPAGYKFKCVSAIGHENEATGSIFPEKNPERRAGYREREAAFVARSGANMPSCRRCRYLPLCDGGCAHMAAAFSGGFHLPSCHMHREVVDDKIRWLHASERARLDKQDLSHERAADCHLPCGSCQHQQASVGWEAGRPLHP
jgi:uncharacterized protein